MTFEDDRKPHKHPKEPDREVTNHVHVFITMANAAKGHQHMLLGTTSPAIYRKSSHVHRVWIRTSFDPKNGDSHWHEAKFTTGPALETPDGEHTHYYSGETSYDLDHCHRFSSVTDTAPDEDDDDCDDNGHHHHDDCDDDCD